MTRMDRLYSRIVRDSRSCAIRRKLESHRKATYHRSIKGFGIDYAGTEKKFRHISPMLMANACANDDDDDEDECENIVENKQIIRVVALQIV